MHMEEAVYMCAFDGWVGGQAGLHHSYRYYNWHWLLMQVMERRPLTLSTSSLDVW